MAERYTRVFSLAEKLYAQGSPVLIEAGALLKDNQTGKILAQLKFKNLDRRIIKAVKVSIDAFDIEGHPLEGIGEYTYLDLNASRGESFGSKIPVVLPDSGTRSFKVRCTGVIFSDGASHTCDGSPWEALPYQSAPAASLGSQDLADQLYRDLSRKLPYAPLKHKDLWLCGCGETNRWDEASCHSCGQERDELFAAFEAERLQQHKQEYDAEQERLRLEWEAAAKAAAQKRKKIAVIISSVLAAVAAIAAIAALVIYVIIPTIKYNDAVALKDAGQYEEAIAAFETLDGYKDSAEQIKACGIAFLGDQYVAAVALKDAGNYEEAIAAFKALGDYEIVADQIAACETAILEEKYNAAAALIDAGKIADGYRVLLELDGYKDSAEKIKEYRDEVFKSAQVGDSIYLGKFDQNLKDDGAEPIEWRVLEVKNEKMLVISEYSLITTEYDKNSRNLNWKNCSLRAWLNGEFIDSAFSEEEKSMIIETEIDNERSVGTTYDNIFLLNKAEVEEYFKTGAYRACEPTQFAGKSAERFDATTGWVNNWWLRDCGVHYSGSFYEYEASYGFGVRPAMWIELNG